ncbi:MAG: hypothetical protein LBL17_02440 [Coxiellaceae bacterium]|jgi:uncharacterized protein YbaR (Trm112 family)|nr:hypothetical protein [Coxiellaceae bacterium]
MYKWLTDILVCPKTKLSLTITKIEEWYGDDIYTDVLRSADGTEYIIRNGIPRFVDQCYASSFGLQWGRHIKDQIDSPRSDHSRRRFYGETGFVPAKLKGKLVLDGGCGAGRFSDIAASDGGCCGFI